MKITKIALCGFLCISIYIIGCLSGAFLRPQVLKWMNNNQSRFSIDNLMSLQLVNMQTEVAIPHDTLSAHNHNLLVFWSPTCKYCRQFFNYSLNFKEVGIFCIPLTDDFEYTRYYIEQKEIPYLQLCIADTNGIEAIDAPFVKAIPTFILLDSKGNIIDQKEGIADIDSFLEKIYK